MAILLSGAQSTFAGTQTVVSLTFDNNTVSQYSLGYQQALAPAGAKATFYVNSGTVSASSKFMSWSQLSTLAANGQDIGGKTVDGVSLTTLTAPQQIAEICNDRQAISGHGLSPTTFAYPGGANNATIQSEVQSCGYGNARTAGSISATGPVYAETLPAKSWLGVRAYAPAGQVTLAAMQSVVTAAAAHGGGWVPIVIAKVCSQALDPSNYSSCTTSAGWVELADLQSFISWMQNSGLSGGGPAGAQLKTVAAAVASSDTSAPVTTIACAGSPCQQSQYPSTVSVTLSATDTGSGVASTHYTTDGSAPTLASPLYSGPIGVTASATVSYRSWDIAGNAEAVHTQAISVQQPPDSIAPTTSISCGGSGCRTGSYYAPVTVALNGTDNPGGWGVDKTYYTTDGTTPTTSSRVYNGPFVVNGPTNVQYFSMDLAGNAEQVQSQQIKVTTVVSLTFDDAYENQWLYAVPLLRSHSMNATFYPITSDSDVPYACCMSWGQMATLQSQGDDIGSHTINHPDLTQLTPAQIQQEVCGSRQDMINNGITNPVSFAYPFGTYNATVEAIVQQCGFTNARIGGGVSTSNTTPTAPYLETLAPRDPMAVRTIAVDGASPITLADLESFVTAASAHGGGWLPITFHNVCDQGATDFTSCMASYGPIQDTVLSQFLDWLGTAGQPGGAPAGVSVLTMRDAMTAGAGN
jgi:peptidoglycan/xylan/chitin deacetylase (PgdA/CDA1 family)